MKLDTRTTHEKTTHHLSKIDISTPAITAPRRTKTYEVSASSDRRMLAETIDILPNLSNSNIAWLEERRSRNINMQQSKW